MDRFKRSWSPNGRAAWWKRDGRHAAALVAEHGEDLLQPASFQHHSEGRHWHRHWADTAKVQLLHAELQKVS